MGNVYKDEISKLLKEYGWLTIPPLSKRNGREDCLILDDEKSPCRADFCYHIPPSGRLFIEDDDTPRGLNNLVKYWRWCQCRSNPDTQPVYLVHILDTDKGVWANHCKFIGKQMERELERNKFSYLPMSADRNWHDHEKWLPKLKRILDQIAIARQEDKP